jgi:hypothetical protein
MRSQTRWITAAVAAAVAALAMGQASAQSYGYSNNGYSSNNGYGYGHTQIVRCESVGSRRNFCRVNTQGSVRITRQLSNRTCIQGRNWSYNSQGIVVSGGCRAEFAVGSRRQYRNGDSYGSNGYNSSGSQYGNDYNYTNNGYQNNDSGHTHYVDNSGRVIHCQSTIDGRNYCGDAHTHYSMSGNRDPDCIEGQTWGTDSRGVWVSGDCDADFSTGDQYNDNTDYSDHHH